MTACLLLNSRQDSFIYNPIFLVENLQRDFSHLSLYLYKQQKPHDFLVKTFSHFCISNANQHRLFLCQYLTRVYSYSHSTQPIFHWALYILICQQLFFVEHCHWGSSQIVTCKQCLILTAFRICTVINGVSPQNAYTQDFII